MSSTKPPFQFTWRFHRDNVAELNSDAFTYAFCSQGDTYLPPAAGDLQSSFC